jgi:hypothetical protein
MWFWNKEAICLSVTGVLKLFISGVFPHRKKVCLLHKYCTFDWIVPLLLFLINHTRENLKYLSSTPACCFRPTVWIPTGNARVWGFKHWTHAQKLYEAPWWVIHPICIFRGFQHPALAQLCVHVKQPLTFLQINLQLYYQHLADPGQGAHTFPTRLGVLIQEAGDWKACVKPGCRKQI